MTPSAAAGIVSQVIPDELMAAYLATDIDVWAPDRMRVAGAGACEVLPWPSLGVITAWNPGSQPTPSDNDFRNAHLADLLRQAGVALLPAVGSGTDGWFERSFAVPDPDVDHLLALGRRFDQHGIFLVTADALTVIDCADGARTSGPRRTDEGRARNASASAP